MSSANPLGLHVAANRVLSERLGRRGEPECPDSFQLEQAVTLADAIDAFTSGSPG